MSETGRKTTVVCKAALPAILLIFTLLLISGVASAATLVVNQTAPPCRQANPDVSGNYFTTIQAAVDAASEDDTIIVCPGTYQENIVVTTPRLTIQSDAGQAVTIIQSNATDTDVVTIEDTTEVTLDGFTIRDAWGTTADVAGIFMDNVSKSTIANNLVINITDQIDAYGIAVNDSHNNSFNSNSVTNISGSKDAAGIVVGASSNNSFCATSVMNISAEGMAFGIVLAVSDYNRFDKTVVSYINSAGLFGVAIGDFFGDGITTGLTTELESNAVSLDGAMACGIFLAESNFSSFDRTKVSYVMAECGEAAGILLLVSFFNTFNDDTDVSYILADGLCLTGQTAETIFDVETATLNEFKQALDGSIAVGIKLAIAMNNTFNDQVTVAHINGSEAACGVVLFILADDNEFHRCTISDLYSGSPETTFGVLLFLSGDNLFDELKISAGNGPPIDLGVILVWSWDNTFQDSDITDCMIGILLTAIGVPSPYGDLAPQQCYNTIVGSRIHENLVAMLLLDEWENEIVDNCIENNLAGIILLSSWNNTIERNMIRNNTGGARCGVYIDSSSDLNEIHRNCFYYNGPPQAMDNHSVFSNNWDGNYWEPAPGLSEDPFLILGAAMQRDNAPLRQCPLCPTQAPVVTPLGLVALIGLLSVIATLTLVRRKRR